MASSSTDASASTSEAIPKIRHEWYQSDSEVVLSIFIRNTTEEDLTIEYEENSLSVWVKQAGSSDKFFGLDPLTRAIDVAQCSHRVIPAKIEIKLRKKEVGHKWGQIEGEEVQLTTAGAADHKPTYPTSSKKATNWDRLANDAMAEEAKLAKAHEKDPNAQGDKKLNELFQQLYADATDDQRRAMVKSYSESNGTSLSTVWDEVGHKRVETVPPESMIAKKWGA